MNPLLVLLALCAPLHAAPRLQKASPLNQARNVFGGWRTSFVQPAGGRVDPARVERFFSGKGLDFDGSLIAMTAQASGGASGLASLHPTQDVEIDVNGEPKTLDKKTFTLKRTAYLRFADFRYSDEGLPEPTVNGKPAGESGLDYKHSAWPVSSESHRKHSYSFLALPKTAAGKYVICFPGKMTFTIEVLDETAKSAWSKSFSMMELEDADSPAPASGVDPWVQRLMEVHCVTLRRHLASYGRRLIDGYFVSGVERERRIAELDAVMRLHEDILAGKGPAQASQVLELLLRKEASLTRHYKAYVLAEPAFGTIFARERWGLFNHHIELMRQLLESVQHRERPQTRADRLRDSWMIGFQSLMHRLAWWQVRAWVGLGRISSWLAPPKQSLHEQVLIYVPAMTRALDAYLEEDSKRPFEEKEALLKKTRFLAEFAASQRAGTGFAFSPASLAKYVLHHDLERLIAEFDRYGARDLSGTRKQKREAVILGQRLLAAARAKLPK